MQQQDYITFAQHWNLRNGEPKLNEDEDSFTMNDCRLREMFLMDFEDFDISSILRAMSVVSKTCDKVTVKNVITVLDFGTVNKKELEPIATELWHELLDNYHACTDIIFGDLRAAIAFRTSFGDFETFTDYRWADIKKAEQRFVQAYCNVRMSQYKDKALDMCFVPCGSHDRSVCAVGDKSIAKSIANKVYGEGNYRCVNTPAVTMSRAQYLQCLNNFEQDIHPGKVPTSAKLGGKNE